MLRFTTLFPLVLFVFLMDSDQLIGADASYEELCQQGRQLVDTGDHRQAVAVYTNAIDLDPAGPYAYVGRAVAYLAGRRYEDAANDCSKAMERAPTEPVPVLLRGDARRSMGELELALADYAKAIEIDPARPDAHFKRAEVHLEQNDYDRALRDYSKALDLRTDNPAALLGRAQAYCGRGDYSRAVLDYTAAIELASDVASHYFLRAQANFDREAHERVIDDCTEAIRLDSGFAAAYGLRAAAFVAEKRYDRAIDDLDEAVRLAPMDAGAFLWRGRAKARAGEFQQAVADYTEAIRIDPKYTAAYEGRATAYEKTGQIDPAKADIVTARELAAAASAAGSSKAAVRDSQLLPGHSAELAATLSKSDKSLPAMLLLDDVVQSEATQEQARANRLKEELEACEGPLVVPESCTAADDVLDRSVALLASGNCEVAAAGFRSAQKRYAEAFEAFEAVTRATPALWLDWARQRANRHEIKDERVMIWLALAEASHLLGDHEGYTSAMEKAATTAKSQALVDPTEGVIVLLSIADIQYRCEDRVGAKKTTLVAVSFCEGVQNPVRKAYRLARCTGMFGRLGESDEWARHLQLTYKATEGLDSYSYPLAQRNRFLTCLAYAEALSPAEALKYAQALGKNARSTPYEWTGPGFAAIALAAAKQRNTQDTSGKLLQTAYVATCSELSYFFAHQLAETSSIRLTLAATDAEIGQNERAFVTVANIPNPNQRATALAEMVRNSFRCGRFDEAIEWSGYIPEYAAPTGAPFWVAMAKVHQDRQTMAQMKRWAIDTFETTEEILALAGIAAALGSDSVKAVAEVGSETDSGNAPVDVEPGVQQVQTFADQGDHLAASQAFAAILRENRSDANVRNVFDKSAAQAPEWWVQQASSFAQRVDDPCHRASVMLQLARMYTDIKNDTGFATATAECARCTCDVWDRILSRRSRAYADYSGEYRWPESYQTKKTESAEINSILQVLMDLETFQNENGKKNAGLETLLLALRCADGLPHDQNEMAIVRLDSLGSWYARIGGRFRDRGDLDLAEAIMSDIPWQQGRPARNSDLFLAGVAAAEAGVSGEVEGLAETLRQEAHRRRSGTDATYAATLYGFRAGLAAENGDEAAFTKAAMTVGGLVNKDQNAASHVVLVRLAEATALLGQLETARDYLNQSEVRDTSGDRVLVLIVRKLLENGDLIGARKTLKEIYDPVSTVPAWYEMTKAEASAPSARLSAVYEEIEGLSHPADQAAALAGVAAALLSK